MKEIIYYTTSDGKCPYKKWVKELNLEYRLRIDKRINRLQEGYFGDHKKLTNSQLSELRFNFGAGYRIYYKELDDIIILILAGSDKSEQTKTIKQAEKYLEEMLNRSDQ